MGGGKEDHALCSTGPPRTTGPPRSYHLRLPFQQAQDSLQKQTRLLLNLNSSVTLSQKSSVGLISLSQRTFLFLGRVRVTLCQAANELSLGTPAPEACPF